MPRLPIDGRKGTSNMKYCHTNPPDHLSEELCTIWNQGIPWGDSESRDRHMSPADADRLRYYIDLAFESPPFAQMCKGSAQLTCKGRNVHNKDPHQRIECSFCHATTGCFKIQGCHLDCKCTNTACGKMCKKEANRNVFPLLRLNCEHADTCPIGINGQYRNSLIQGISDEIKTMEEELIA